MNYALETLEIKKSETEDRRQAYLLYQNGRINDETCLSYGQDIKDLEDAIALLKQKLMSNKPTTALKKRWDI